MPAPPQDLQVRQSVAILFIVNDVIGAVTDQKRGSFNARGSFLAKLQAGHAAHEDRGHGAEDDFEPAHRYHTPKSILTHASPDIQIAAASLALESYHDPLNSLMARVQYMLSLVHAA